MIRVSNRKTVRRLGRKAMGASKTRNMIAVLAIALTTLLFTALFTIAMSINDGFQESTFRQVGGWSHGGFKYLTEEQFEELREDPLIEEWGLRRFLGMPIEAPFHKSHVEIGCSDPNQAKWMYCQPEEGRLPQENTNEAATDTRVLELLGVEPELGTEFTLTFLVDGVETTQTFTLCGWWTYDEAVTASHVLVPESRVNEVLMETGVDPAHTVDGLTGSWNLDVMLGSSLHIEEELRQILANHSYQVENPGGEDYIDIGVNWGYTGAQLADGLDPMTVLALAAMLLLIIFTGWLIIYNVFQISVTNDIRFYGLLKTIGTTGRQIKTILRQQALLLSVIGIPAGLLLGWLMGGELTPVIVAQLNGIYPMVSADPVIFGGAAVFALVTVLLSCARPGRMAAKVSPVEAARRTEGDHVRQKVKKAQKGASLPAMAWANLGRSRGKTLVTVVSMSLAVVLLTMTVTFTRGFDMDKYLSNFVCTDFVLADAGHFQTAGLFSRDKAVPQSAIDEVNAQGGVTGGAKIYGRTSPVWEEVTEDWFRESRSRWYSQEELDRAVSEARRTDSGLLFDNAQLYGMEPFALDRLRVLEGDLSRLYEPGGNYVAAVCSEDDYGDPEPDSHWARVGDTVTLTYPAGEADYQVAALVTVPRALSYRYYGSDEFVLNHETFLRNTGTADVMAYVFDTTGEDEAAMEAFLSDYTQNQNPQLDYESKALYMAEFESTRSMFLLMGGALSFVVGLVGVLNFFNAILTGILTRRREFAVLQAVGMTGRQLKTMLVWEGLLYALGAVGLSLALTLMLSPLLAPTLEGLFWFFTYRFTLTPVVILAPVFLLLGSLVPLGVYPFAAKATLVERLRQVET